MQMTRAIVSFVLTALLTATAVHAQGVGDDVERVPDGTVFEPAPAAAVRLDERCVVSILNRTAKVRADGTFVIGNVPSNFGPVRAHATCIVRGTTVTGQSDLFVVPPSGVIDTGSIEFDIPQPIPASLAVTASTPTLPATGATAQLTVTAVFADASTENVTADPATSYRSSNPAIGTVSAAGVVTGVSSGPVLVTVLYEGVSGFVRLSVAPGATDSDGDGIPDDVEVANGLDPADPLDGFADPDGDGLTTRQELVDVGTNPHVADTDGDGLSDGQEVSLGTNPLVADTDGDGVRDGLEVQIGSDPLDPTSVDLAATLDRFEVTPVQFRLVVDTIDGVASLQLVVTGHLIDGTTIDLTQTARGTTYVSSDLTVCNLGGMAGRVVAGNAGSCTITVANSGFSAAVQGDVVGFAPRALSFVAIPGFANNVDVRSGFAFVAAGATGLQVVDVANRANPHVVAALDTPGNANDVRVVGTTAYVADGSSGLQVIDVTNPLAPVLRGSVDTPGTAQDVVVKGAFAYVADGNAGLRIVDVGNPAAPALRGTVDTPGTAKGVDVATDRAIAAVADGSGGLRVIDVANPNAPAIVGSVAAPGTNDARDVVVQGAFAFVADVNQGFLSVELGDPSHPVIRAISPQGGAGRPTDVALAGRFAGEADTFFTNAVPILDVGTPANPIPRAFVDFSTFRGEDGTGIAVDEAFVYLTSTQGGATENGSTGTTRLYVGQYRSLTDPAGIPPSVQITAPAAGATVIENDALTITVAAIDDVEVAAVSLLVNGVVVATKAAPPFQFGITVPPGVASLRLGARAIDPGNTLGVAPDVVVGVIPDPNTTVQGRAVDLAGNPLPGATVTCLGVSGQTGADGRFSVAGVSTIRGNVQCAGRLVVKGVPQTDTVLGGAPVRGGITTTADLVLRLRVRFAAEQSFGAGFNPDALVVADFNGDGKADVVTADGNPSASAVAVILGRGDGTFQSEQRFPVGQFPTNVAVADLNADGRQDVVAANRGTNDVSVLLGKGDGTFQLQKRFPVGSIPAAVAIADFNDDGRPDIVTANNNSADVAVFLGVGDGTFLAPQRFAASAVPNAVAAGDLDGDHHADIVTVANDVAVLFGNGNGTFRPKQGVAFAGAPRDVLIIDLDGDGKQDLLIADATADTASVLYGRGDGTFLAQQSFPAGDGPVVVAVADVDGFGVLDILTANSGTNEAGVLIGRGDGTFLPPLGFTARAGSTTHCVAAADLNGDGRLDLLTCGFNSGHVVVRLQQPQP
ncbi:MAG TPA: FG-GAP-like repeat-containing protein [Candidatus Binatia bacterium]|jgi:hypothetical protein|nr:FG-GAP-like repeat-containing protein [Candidatus Binatia bacterium]